MKYKQIAIGCDHAGYEMKEFLKRKLQKEDIVVRDFGTDGPESVDYPDFVHPLADAVEQGTVPLGILLCGSANGVAMTANKHQGIRAAICWKSTLAALARQHNDANVLCIPARFVSTQMGWKMTKAFLATDFEGGRHQRRVDKISC